MPRRKPGAFGARWDGGMTCSRKWLDVEIEGERACEETGRGVETPSALASLARRWGDNRLSLGVISGERVDGQSGPSSTKW